MRLKTASSVSVNEWKTKKMSATNALSAMPMRHSSAKTTSRPMVQPMTGISTSDSFM